MLQSLAGVRKSVGLDGPQQLLDSTAPPVDLRAMAGRCRCWNRTGIVDRGFCRCPSSPAPAAAAAPGNGLSPAEIDVELATVPEPQRMTRRHAALLGPCRRSGPLGKSGERHLETFNADNLYEKIDGRAESFIQYGVKGMAYAFYHPTGDPSNELQLYVFEMGDSLKALGKYGSEKPDEFKAVAIGERRLHKCRQHIVLLRGGTTHRSCRPRTTPKFGAFALDLAKRVAARQQPGVLAPQQPGAGALSTDVPAATTQPPSAIGGSAPRRDCGSLTWRREAGHP